MACDDDKVIRQLSWMRMLKPGANDPNDIQGIRTFKIPNLNSKAGSYYNIIDWQNIDVSEPPVTKNIEMNQINSSIQMGNKFHNLFIHIPSHKQAVKCHIKLVTEASLNACRESNRDGYIHCSLHSRKQLLCFNGKIQFK